MVMNETRRADKRLLIGRGVDIRAIDDMTSGVENITRDFYFEGLNVLRCYEGRYRFARKGHPDVFLEPGEIFVIYPGHLVTIDALKKSNRLVYGIFTGKNVADYFNALGFFDGMHGKAMPRYESVKKLCDLMQQDLYQTESGHDTCIGYLSDLMISIVNDVRTNGNAFVFDAIRQIRRNLSKGVVRLQELCDDLDVCRSYLHRVFREEGLGSISEFIKSEQLNQALCLLRDTELPIGEIAKASGFVSATHFSTFVKKRVGRSPRELRH